MSHTLDEVRQIAFELPEEDRRQLANSLWETLTLDNELSEAEFNAAWGDEIKHRVDEIDSGKVKLIPLEEVLAEMDELIAPLKK